jgi:MFS family permease
MKATAEHATEIPQQTKRQRVALITGGLAHIIHDGLTDMLYVLFPIWQGLLGLSFAEVGFLKTLFSGTMALFQVPVGIISLRLGEVRMLVLGTLLTSSAMFFLGWGRTTIFLGIFLVIGGLGSSVQHPLSSSLITSSYPDPKRRRVAPSTFNFCGDLGKLILPATAAFLITQFDWSTASRTLGILGLLIAGFIYWLTRNFKPIESRAPEKSPQEKAKFFIWKGKFPFLSLSMIGVLDSATRMGFLTFFPFLLREKGGDIALVGVALTLVFAGGAVGKLACGILATRFGSLRTVIITEISTALCILGIKALPLYAALFLAPFLGVALNGTSSVLYGSVPELVGEKEQKQAFSLFYTATIGSGAISPFLYGLISDQMGIGSTVFIIAFVVLLTIPLTYPLRKRIE